MESNMVFKEMLNVMDFQLEKYDDGFGLIDLQGANWGDIESDRFRTAAEIIERITIYLDGYYYDDLTDIASRYFENETLPYTAEEWTKFMNDHESFKVDYMHEFKVMDLIANHTNEVDLNEVYKGFCENGNQI